MTYSRSFRVNRRDVVEQTLGPVLGGGSWHGRTWRPHDAFAMPVEAVLEGEWLRLRSQATCDLDPVQAVSAGNETLSGGVRWGIEPGESQLRLLLDTVIPGSTGGCRGLAAGAEAMREAVTATQGPPGHAPAGCRPVIQDPEAERATAAVRQAGLNALAAQSGWRADCDPTVDGDSLVWIDETDNVAATLTATDDCVCAITRLFLERPAADACCTALALYLLRLSAQVRLVRMTLEESNLVLESILPAKADVETVSTVLGALSAAMAWCRDEAEVLVRAPAVAEAYLKFSAVCAGLWRTQSSDEKQSVPAVSVAGVM